ncbi:MAG: 3-isopropylmalate dehydratase large subunit [Alphaproteobacteria bacterium]|nr:3-isopropylmalate dehydratase large subunit [Alphaproteobacteria bacterium]
MSAPRTLFEKVWARHEILKGPDGDSLLFVDRHYAHEGSFHAFNALRKAGLKVRRPDLTTGIYDHYVPTDAARTPASAEIGDMITLFGRNVAEQGIRAYAPGDPHQGIVHVVGPELGETLPGFLIVCGDSHTATHGAFGALAFGIGASEVAHVLATQTIWQVRPRLLRISVEGRLGAGVTAKDVILAVIARFGANVGLGHAIEFAGSAIRGLTMEGRMTVCNMAIEAGSRTGQIAPDDTTFAWLAGREKAPKGALWDKAVAHWRSLPTDEGARFDRDLSLDASALAPMVTWGTSPEEALPITDRVPDPAAAPDAARKAAWAKSLDYMGLKPGMALDGIAVDRVFIGSCTNARIEDLRAAAAVVKGRKAVVPAWVSSGSTAVKLQAEAEGLDRIFTAAGFEWRESGCSMCVGINGDLLKPGERSASTTNRNFVGRQGPGARTHLVSPAMAAAAAVTGRLTDVRKLAAN